MRAIALALILVATVRHRRNGRRTLGCDERRTFAKRHAQPFRTEWERVATDVDRTHDKPRATSTAGATAPSPRESAGLAADPKGRLVLFGGIGADTDLRDTWTLGW